MQKNEVDARPLLALNSLSVILTFHRLSFTALLLLPSPSFAITPEHRNASNTRARRPNLLCWLVLNVARPEK